MARWKGEIFPLEVKTFKVSQKKEWDPLDNLPLPFPMALHALILPAVPAYPIAQGAPISPEASASPEKVVTLDRPSQNTRSKTKSRCENEKKNHQVGVYPLRGVLAPQEYWGARVGWGGLECSSQLF